MTERRGGVVLPGSGNRLPPANGKVAEVGRAEAANSGRLSRLARFLFLITAASEHCSFK